MLNIGDGNSPISLKDLAVTIIDLAGKKGELEPMFDKKFMDADRSRSREIFNRFCDSSKAKNILSWQPEVNLKAGIQQILKTGVIFDRWENLQDEQN